MKQLFLSMLLLMSFEASAVRCQGKVVQEGDFAYKLEKYCGEPEAIVYEGTKKTYVYTINGRENYFIIKNERIWQED